MTGYQLDGVLYDTNRSSTVATANIYCTNKRTGDQLSTTPNSSGQYVFNAANFANSFVNGDIVELEAKVSGTIKRVKWRTRINTANAGETNNLYLMTEVRVFRKNQEGGVYFQAIKHDSTVGGAGIAVGTSQTTLISPTEVGDQRVALVQVNNDSAQAQTISVWASLDDQPGAPGDTTYWWLISDATLALAATSSIGRAWQIACRWICVTATSAAAVSSGVRAILKATS